MNPILIFSSLEAFGFAAAVVPATVAVDAVAGEDVGASSLPPPQAARSGGMAATAPVAPRSLRKLRRFMPPNVARHDFWDITGRLP